MYKFTYDKLEQAFLDFFYYTMQSRVHKKSPVDAEDLVRNWVHDNYFKNEVYK